MRKKTFLRILVIELLASFCISIWMAVKIPDLIFIERILFLLVTFSFIALSGIFISASIASFIYATVGLFNTLED